jgi:hypothetical protein
MVKSSMFAICFILKQLAILTVLQLPFWDSAHNGGYQGQNLPVDRPIAV